MTMLPLHILFSDIFFADTRQKITKRTIAFKWAGGRNGRGGEERGGSFLYPAFCPIAKSIISIDDKFWGKVKTCFGSRCLQTELNAVA